MVPPPKRKVIIDWRPISGATFRYNKKGTTGAFRVVHVDKLLQGIIEIWEYKDIVWGGKHTIQELANRGFKYTAISHVWSPADDVKEDLARSQQQGTTIDVATGVGETQTISWEGLQDVARAIKKSTKLGKAKFLWLDFLCLDQLDSDDKKGQICLMADIYKHSRSVVVMIGGVSSVHGVEKPTGWIDRAWTLQETILNRNRTYAYVKWDITYPNPVYEAKGGGVWLLEVIKRIKTTTGTADLCLVDIRELLDMADTKLNGVPPVLVMNGMAPLAGDTPRRALRAAMSNNRQVRYTGIWRSLFLRTSALPNDVIYSAMGCFGHPINPKTVARSDIVPVDPHRINRTPMYIFNDFCRKMATQRLSGPAFLTIGGVEGSDIPYQEKSLIPVFPHTEGINEKSPNSPPVLTFGGKSEWVGFHVADSPYFIETTDMVFITHSYPHVVNGSMVRFRKIWRRRDVTSTASGPNVDRKRARATIGSMTGSLHYWANDNLTRVKKGAVMALYVGTIGDMRDKDPGLRFPSSRPSLKGHKYLLFLEYHRYEKSWDIIGNGAFRPDKGWNVPRTQRSVFTLGKGAQTSLSKWPTEVRNWVDTRETRLSLNSYGVLPVYYFEPPKVEDRTILWFGKKHEQPTNRTGFRRCVVEIDIEDQTLEGLAREFARTRDVEVVASKSVRPPATTIERRRPPWVRSLGSYRMMFTFGGWQKNKIVQYSRDGLPGILVPTSANMSWVTYWVQIWFGKSVMYLLVKNYKNARRNYWDITPVPYGPVDGRTLNRGYGGFKATKG
ncbi:hypothetical protein DRE_02774 [Drechslerella stenobrocha 248]|uniref:Heterokaryon incompatibility domain-containing protein n=1 Tax=Drechslerella stenobrocha 248 TaxID=1043628 RepID=W7I5Y6_9PEZI|nr:hypothetical protein DRE_02774 [Drechslerella stenobrocha 248]